MTEEAIKRDKPSGTQRDVWEIVGGMEEAIKFLREEQKDLSRDVREVLLKYANRELLCQIHLSRTTDLERRLGMRPSSSGLPAVQVNAAGQAVNAQGQPASQCEIEQLRAAVEGFEENTERIAIRAVEGRVAGAVIEALRAEREAEEKAAEVRRATAAAILKEQTEAAVNLAKAQAEASAVRWSRVKYLIATLVTLIGSGGGAAWCNLSTRMDADKKTMVQAIKEQPPPVVVKVESKPASKPKLDPEPKPDPGPGE